MKKRSLELTFKIYSQSTQVFQYYRNAFTIQSCNHLDLYFAHLLDIWHIPFKNNVCVYEYFNHYFLKDADY